ncbi:MAG: hypothetical protein V2J24_23765, partial [Pseudomonadales bacterium]|nr:hypothetical protein [Pseudomonadales bacterium]
MPVTTGYSDDEVQSGREGCGEPLISELVADVRELTGEDWIAVRHFKLCDRAWWRKAELVEFWSIARYVGGAGPWQLHGG